MMGAIGLLAFRGVIARPLQVTGGNERALQGVTTAAAVALGVALVAAPVYLLLATAEFSLRPWSDICRGRAARARLRLRSRVQRSLDRARTARRRRRRGPRARPSGTQAAFRARHCWRGSARPGVPRPRSPSRALRATRRRPAPSEPCSRSTGRIWPQRRSGSAGSSACSSWRRRRRRGSASRCSRSSSRASRVRRWAASPSCSRPGSSRASSICRR